MPNKTFMDYVFKRVDETLSNNAEYMQMQSDCIEAEKSGDTESLQEITCIMETKVEELCYMAGFRDAMAIINNNM